MALALEHVLGLEPAPNVGPTPTGAVERPQLRLVSPYRPAPSVYRRRRAVVAVVLALVLVVLFVGFERLVAAVDGASAAPRTLGVVADGSAAAPTAAATAGSSAHVIAQPGDTMWSIAGRIRGDRALADVVADLVVLNGGAGLSPGQYVIVPAGG
jgi:hypothetical protein